MGATVKTGESEKEHWWLFVLESVYIYEYFRDFPNKKIIKYMSSDE
jgi:hypothetical protein